MNKIVIVKQEEKRLLLDIRNNKEEVIASYELTTLKNGAINFRTLQSPES